MKRQNGDFVLYGFRFFLDFIGQTFQIVLDRPWEGDREEEREKGKKTGKRGGMRD